MSDPVSKAGPAAKRREAAGSLALLRCPSCGGALEATLGRIRCSACRNPILTPDGILDFVAGAADTQLDPAHYDAAHAIDVAAASRLFDGLSAAAGPRWPATFGNVVEIGCGTGGFSMAFLSRGAVRRAVLTDVSVGMLRVCRAHLRAMESLLQARDLVFATFSGTERCFAPGAFDTGYGTAVLHHIADVPRVMGLIHDLLKPGGRAFFMEPASPFHQALTLTMADVVAALKRAADVAPLDVVRIANWLAEIHCNVVNTGDLEVLADREDKHQFVAEDLDAIGRAAGFGCVEVLPAGPDPTGAGTMKAYLRQIGVEEATLARVADLWPKAQQRYFGRLATRDQAPSYLYWLEKRRAKAAPRQARSVELPDGRSDVPIVTWLQLSAEPRGAGLAVTVSGWCVAVQRLKSVEVTVGDVRRRLPIFVSRPDVLAAVNADGAYPNLHALCSGIQGEVPVSWPSAGAAEVLVAAVAVGGRRIPLGAVPLHPGGGARTLQVALRAEAG